ncbi:MAG: hypothetical protein ACFFAQ_13625 [Promethearchaeota archaeon]
MNIEGFRDILSLINLYVEFILLPLMAGLVLRKVIKEKQRTGEINYIRFIIACVFLSFSWTIIWEFLSEKTPLADVIPNQLIGNGTESFGFYNLGIGLMVSFGILLPLYITQKETFYYVPFFIFGGMYIYYLFTGYDAWLMNYIELGGIIGLISLFFVAFRYKDNGSLGLAIFFLFAFLVLILENIFATLMNSSYIIFGVILSLGYFKPFKVEVENKDD